MKIVITDSSTVSNNDIDLDVFAQFGELVKYERTSIEELPERISDCDAIICNKTPLNDKVLDGAKNLRYIGLFATGYNNVDLNYTNNRGITVSNAGEYSTKAVAQHTFALLLNHFNSISRYDAYVKEGKWIGIPTFCPFDYKMSELQNKTIGLIGYGSIARQVTALALAFDMTVLSYTRTSKQVEGVEFVDLEELLKRADVVSMHCPLNEQSYKMCNETFFKQCKDGAYFINTARGAIIDEGDLYKALESGKLSGAAIDVLETEPMEERCDLINAPNITITPHVAWAATETRERLVEIVVDNLKHYIEGNPTNVVGK